MKWNTVYDPKRAGKTFQFEILIETVIGNFPDKTFLVIFNHRPECSNAKSNSVQVYNDSLLLCNNV